MKKIYENPELDPINLFCVSYPFIIHFYVQFFKSKLIFAVHNNVLQLLAF